MKDETNSGMKTNETPTHGIVHAGFRGIRAFVTRKKGRCKLLGNRFELPHDTIPSTVVKHLFENFPYY